YVDLQYTAGSKLSIRQQSVQRRRFGARRALSTGRSQVIRSYQASNGSFRIREQRAESASLAQCGEILPQIREKLRIAFYAQVPADHLSAVAFQQHHRVAYARAHVDHGDRDLHG